MQTVQLTVHAITPDGVCSLSGKEGEVLVVTFGDGTLTEGPLSQKSLLQLLRMKFGQQTEKKPRLTAEPVGNGTPMK